LKRITSLSDHFEAKPARGSRKTLAQSLMARRSAKTQ